VNAGAAAVAGKSRLAVTLARLWQALEARLDVYRNRITAVFDQHPDHALFGSLSGAGGRIAPRLLAGVDDDQSVFPEAERLQCVAGTAPAAVQSSRRAGGNAPRL